MANTKLSALTALASGIADTDEFYINDGGTSKKIAYSVLRDEIRKDICYIEAVIHSSRDLMMHYEPGQWDVTE